MVNENKDSLAHGTPCSTRLSNNAFTGMKIKSQTWRSFGASANPGPSLWVEQYITNVSNAWHPSIADVRSNFLRHTKSQVLFIALGASYPPVEARSNFNSTSTPSTFPFIIALLLVLVLITYMNMLWSTYLFIKALNLGVSVTGEWLSSFSKIVI